MLSLQAILDLQASLPPKTDIFLVSDPDIQARSVLTFLLDWVEFSEGIDSTTPALSPERCPNCGGLASSDRSPYCGTVCREESSFIRQFRGGLSEGTILDRERQASIGQVLWHLLGGGYPRRQKLVDEKARSRILARFGGICQCCEAPATTFDHITTACNRPINLRSVCSSCTTTRQFEEPDFLASSPVKDKLKQIGDRIGTQHPIRPCDDPNSWDWRAYLAARKGQLK